MDAVTRLQGAKTILIVAHRQSTLADCDLVVRLENGRIVGSGSPSEMLAKNEAEVPE